MPHLTVSECLSSENVAVISNLFDSQTLKK